MENNQGFVSHYLNERETFDFAGLKYKQLSLFPRTLECVLVPTSLRDIGFENF